MGFGVQSVGFTTDVHTDETHEASAYTGADVTCARPEHLSNPRGFDMISRVLWGKIFDQ